MLGVGYWSASPTIPLMVGLRALPNILRSIALSLLSSLACLDRTVLHSSVRLRRLSGAGRAAVSVVPVQQRG